jgi:hypothetical protein
MKLKRKLTKAEFDALDKALQVFYTADGDSYNLMIETSADDDPGELRRARDREKENARVEKERADRLQTEMDKLVANPDKLKDIKTLETSWQNKLNDQKTAWETEKKGLLDKLNKALVRDKARQIAAKLTATPENALLLEPHILPRLTADTSGDEAVTRVLDREGKLSAATLEEFEKEIVANKTYSGIIVATKASGGADPSKRTSSSAVPNGKKFNEMTEQERVEWFKSDPEGFKAAKAEHQRSTRKF